MAVTGLQGRKSPINGVVVEELIRRGGGGFDIRVGRVMLGP
jgi:hypothetical protein